MTADQLADQPATADAATAARVRLSQVLSGLGRRAARLQDEGPGGAEALEAVAEMANELAAALAAFDRSGDAGLLSMLTAVPPQGGGVEGMAMVTEGDRQVVSPASDAAEALSVFRATLGTVGTALRGLTTGGDGTRSSLFANLSEVLDGAAAGEGVMAVTAGAGAAVASTGAAAVGEGAEVAAMTTALGAAGPQAEGDEAGPLLLPQAVSRADPPPPGVAELLNRIVSMATAVNAAPQAGESVTEAGGGPSRRLTAEDVIAALPREMEVAQRATVAAAERASQGRAPDQPRFAEVLADQVRAAEVSEGRTRIELSPRGLGSIEIDVTDVQDGSLKVVVRAENAAVLNALREERDLLAEALGGLGGGALDLQSFSQQGAENGGSGQNGGFATAPPGPEAERTGAMGEARAEPDLIGLGRLDIMT